MTAMSSETLWSFECVLIGGGLLYDGFVAPAVAAILRKDLVSALGPKEVNDIWALEPTMDPEMLCTVLLQYRGI